MGNIVDELPVEELKKTIADHVVDAVNVIIQKRISENAFKDSITVNEKYFTSTCEGIESILIPSSTFPQLTFENLLKEFPDLPNVLIQDAQYILERISKNRKHLAPGDPYVTGSKARIEKYQVPNLDSTAFMISTLLHIRDLLLKKYIKVEKELLNQINETINDGVNTVLQYHIKDEGWPFGKTKKRGSHLYFTWSVLETLSDFLETENKEGLITVEKDIQTKFKQATSWVEDNILFEMVNGPLYVTTGNEDTANRMKTYNYLQGLIVLHLGRSKKFEDIVTFINKFYAICYRILPSDSYETLYELENATLEDSSIAPLALRAIVPIILENSLDDIFNTEINKSRLSHSAIISDIVNSIYKKRNQDKLFAYDSKKYELYYTERVIEAFTICYQQLEKLENIKLKKLKKGLEKAHN